LAYVCHAACSLVLAALHSWPRPRRAVQYIGHTAYIHIVMHVYVYVQSNYRGQTISPSPARKLRHDRPSSISSSQSSYQDIHEMRKRRRYSISPQANTPIAFPGRASSAATCREDWVVCWAFVHEDNTSCGEMTTECLMIPASRCLIERGEEKGGEIESYIT
jgi:hypothetical protein